MVLNHKLVKCIIEIGDFPSASTISLARFRSEADTGLGNSTSADSKKINI